MRAALLWWLGNIDAGTCQCFLLKSLKEPLGGGGNGRLGVVLSQIILDRLFSTGDITSASRNIRKKAMENMSNMPNETTIASNITGMTASLEFHQSLILLDTLIIHDEFEIESSDCV